MSIGNKFINQFRCKRRNDKLGPNKDEFLSVNKKIFKDQLIKLVMLRIQRNRPTNLF